MNEDIELAERKIQQGKLVNILSSWLKKGNNEINEAMKTTYCHSCDQKTRSMRAGRANYQCENCDYNKTLHDFFIYEALENSSIKGLIGD